MIVSALKSLGFSDVQETAVGAQLVSDAYAEIMHAGKQNIIITSCCPTINMLIQKYYPTMLPYLAKVLTPMQAHCKLIKEQDPEAYTVFIGPCIAKKKEGDESPWVDAVLTFDEAYEWFMAEGIDLPYHHVDADKHDGKSARFYPTTGGVLKTMEPEIGGYTYLALDGVDNCIAALKDIISGNIRKCFVEMSACTGRTRMP